MNTFQLLNAMEQDPKSNGKFCGVYSSDTLPAVIEHYPCGLIVNTDPHREKGSHWVAMYFPSDENGEFFDSYGYPPEFYRENFKTFLESHTRKWKYNHRTLQSLNSNSCGQFCLYFVINRNHGRSMSMIVNSFSKNLILNDQRVTVFAKKYLRYVKPNIQKDKKQVVLSRKQYIYQ